MAQAFIESHRTHVLPLEFDRAMPVIVRGEGVWVEDAAGRRYLDAMSGGSMAATLGHGRQRPRRRRPDPGGNAGVRAQRAPHHPSPGTPRAGAGRGRARRVQPRPLHGQRRRRERDGDPAGAQLPRGARRARALAGDLTRSGLSRSDDGDARPHRPPRACTDPSARTCLTTCTSRRARGTSTRPARPPSRPSTRRSMKQALERLRVLLRGDQLRRPSRILPAPAVLGGPGRAARAPRLPRLLRRGRDRHGSNGELVRGR